MPTANDPARPPTVSGPLPHTDGATFEPPGQRLQLDDAVVSFACNHSCTLLGGRPKKGTGIGTAWSAGLLVLVLFVGLPSPLAHARAAGCRGAGVRPNGTNAAVVDAATLCL